MGAVAAKIDTRTRLMYERYEAGATLAEVGEEFNLTRARVAQVFDTAGLPVRTLAETGILRRKLASEAARERSHEIRAAFARLRDKRAVARELGIPTAVITEVMAADPSVYRFETRAVKKKYETDELLDILRQAQAALGGILTVQDYLDFAKGRTFPDGRRWPTNQTFQHRFGSWRGALAEAGLAANPPSAIAGQRLFDEGHCIDALRHAARELGKRPTADAYEQLAAASGGGLPSLATVRHRIGHGTWIEALRRAGV